MLDFIVLGIIPGTHIQLSFIAVGIMLGLVVLASYKMYRNHGRRQMNQQRQQFDFISLQNLEQA